MHAKAYLMNCKTLADIDYALNSSWCGYNVIAVVSGIEYHLYSDMNGEVHEQLMRMVAPAIVKGDSVEILNSKYTRVAANLTKDWPTLESFPAVQLNSLVSDLPFGHGI